MLTAILKKLADVAVMWHDLRETETVHGRTLEVERGSCSLVLGLSGLDRGDGWTSLAMAMAGARGADIEARSSVDRDAALAGGFRHFSSDEEEVK